VVGGRASLNGVKMSSLNIYMAAIVRCGHVHATAFPLHVLAATTFCWRHSSIRNGAQHRRHE
jgi:hypothetical protein